jgi:hypothetical protein
MEVEKVDRRDEYILGGFFVSMDRDVYTRGGLFSEVL